MNLSKREIELLLQGLNCLISDYCQNDDQEQELIKLMSKITDMEVTV